MLRAYSSYIIVVLLTIKGNIAFNDKNVEKQSKKIDSGNSMISLLLAAYNEEEILDSVVKRATCYLEENYPSDWELVIIDDGSSDSTWNILEKNTKEHKNLIIGKNPKNMGQGAACRRGFTLVKGDIVITNDCDLSYPLKDIPRLISRLKEGFDVVVASPFLSEGDFKDVPIMRKIFSKIAVIIYSRFISSEITCYTGAFRAYKKKVINELDFESNGFEAQTEILWRCRQKGWKIGEVTSKLTLIEGRISRFRPAKVIPKHLALFAKILVNQKPKKT